MGVITLSSDAIILTAAVTSPAKSKTASYAYLGIGIDNKLSWAELISNTVSKTNKVLHSYVEISIVVLVLLMKPLISQWLDRS